MEKLVQLRKVKKLAEIKIKLLSDCILVQSASYFYNLYEETKLREETTKATNFRNVHP